MGSTKRICAFFVEKSEGPQLGNQRSCSMRMVSGVGVHVKTNKVFGFCVKSVLLRRVEMGVVRGLHTMMAMSATKSVLRVGLSNITDESSSVERRGRSSIISNGTGE